MLKASDITKRTREQQESKKEIYLKILKQASRKIENAVLMKRTGVRFKIPSIIFGSPVLTNESGYIARQLVRMGYHVSIIDPMTVDIRWGTAEPKKPEEKKPEIFLDKLANIKKAAQSIRQKAGGFN